ncbi:PspC domain-containing protein [Bacteroidota bacterium]
MKETIKVNISGVIFHIDEDGYDKLRIYLDKISNHFKNKKEGKEIIDDIESRIAELFKEKLTKVKQVISLKDVEEVISVMGEPEDICNDFTYETEQEVGYESTEKRLYRDPEHAVLGGVSGGLAAFFNIDIVWMRLAFVFLFLINGFGLLLYLILWAFVPKARTTAERLEMKGERITISNIEKSVKGEYEKVKDNFKNIKESKGYNKVGNFFEEFFKAIGLIGIGLIVGGFAIIIGFIAIFIFKISFIPFDIDGIHSFFNPGFLEFLFDTTSFSFFLLVAFLTISIPVIAIIYGGIKLIFRFKVNDRLLGRSLFVLWLLSAVVFISQLLIEGKNYRTHRTIYETQVIERFSGNTIYLSVNKSEELYDEVVKFDWNNKYNLFIDEENDQVYGAPVIDIERSHSDYYQLELKIKSFGRNSREARENARNVIYHWELKDSLLSVDQFFTIPDGDKWYMSVMEVTLKIPENKSVYLETSCEEYLYEVDNVENYWDEDMINKKWIMTDNGLSLIKE